jgi:MFS family permease
MTAEHATESSGLGGPFQAFHNRNYLRYWLSGLGMTGAQGIQQLALAWLVLDLTDSAGQLGLVVLVQGVTMTAMSLWGGVIVDRYDRKKLLQISQSFTFLNLVTLGALILSGLVEVWMLFFYAGGLGLMQAITMPARNALIRSIVEDDEMMNAVALNAVQMHTSRIIFPMSAGLIIAALGVGATVLLSAACSLIGIVLLFFVFAEESASTEAGHNARQELAEGVRFAFGHPMIGPVITLALSISSFGLAFMTLGPAFARQEMHFGASTVGFFLMSSGIGSIGGAILMLVIRISPTVQVFVLACAGFALSLLALSLNPIAPLAFLFMGCFGFSHSTLSITAQTIFQTESPARLLGRVVSLWSMGGGIAAITALPIGVVGDLASLRWSIGAVACMLLFMCVIVGLGARPLRWLSRVIPAPAERQPDLAEAAGGD